MSKSVTPKVWAVVSRVRFVKFFVFEPEARLYQKKMQRLLPRDMARFYLIVELELEPIEEEII